MIKYKYKENIFSLIYLFIDKMEFSKKIKFVSEENKEKVKPLINPMKEYFSLQEEYYEKDMGV